MKIKNLISDISSAIENRWGSIADCKKSSTIFELHESITTTRRRIKSLKKEKQQISRGFRDPSLAEWHKTTLKESMQQLSTELKAVESNLKQQEQALLAHFQEDGPKHALLLPARFTHQLENNVSGTFRVLPASSEHKELWNAYAQEHPNASVYHLYEWRDVIESTFGHESQYLIALDSDARCRGIFPLTLLKSRLFGHFAVSVPYFNYGGPLTDNNDIAQQLLKAGSEYCLSVGLEHLEIRATQTLNDWPRRDDKVSMVLQLPESQAQLDKQLGSKLRAQINLAGKANLQLEIGGTELLQDFYRVFAENMRDLGTPVYPLSFFRQILLQFSKLCNIIVVYNGNKPVSCAFLIGYKDMLEIPWASTLRKFNNLNANMLLYRQILGLAIDQGYHYFDFGRSSKDAGTYKFKKQWGAIPVQHYWHYWMPADHEPPQLNPQNPKYQMAIKVWQKLPVWFTRLIGPGLVKNLP